MGKDLGAKFIETYLRIRYPKLRVGIMSFATPLKDYCYSLFKGIGLKDRHHYDCFIEEKSKALPCGLSPVQIWVKFGTEWCRSLDPDIWARQVLNAGFDVTIVPDLRFENEALFLRNNTKWCSLIKIVRPNAPIYDTVADNSLEGNDKIWDYVVQNDGTIQQYHQALIATIDVVRNGWNV